MGSQQFAPRRWAKRWCMRGAMPPCLAPVRLLNRGVPVEKSEVDDGSSTVRRSSSVDDGLLERLFASVRVCDALFAVGECGMNRCVVRWPSIASIAPRKIG